MNNGYIKLWRKIEKSSFYRNPLVCHLAIHLILRANHAPVKMIWNKQEMTVAKGQLITGRNRLSLETGLTHREIRTALKILTNIGFSTSKVTNKFSLITICNYSKYQSPDYLSDQQSDQQVTSKRPASDQQVTTNNNNNNDKNNKNNKNKKKKIKNNTVDLRPNVFKIPSLEEIKEYCLTRENKIDPEQWFDFYQAKGWMIGKNQMKDWQAAIRTWEKNNSHGKTSKGVTESIKNFFKEREKERENAE